MKGVFSSKAALTSVSFLAATTGLGVDAEFVPAAFGVLPTLFPGLWRTLLVATATGEALGGAIAVVVMLSYTVDKIACCEGVENVTFKEGLIKR